MAFNLLTSFARRAASSFFNRRSADQLWKSVFSVSPAGRKKGRGRGARARDLNRGQKIGEGPIRAVLPGFEINPISTHGSSITSLPKYLPPDPTRQARILEKQQDVRRKKKTRVHSLLRGYSGTGIAGTKLGWPMIEEAAPTEDQTTPLAEEAREELSQFQTVCLYMKRRRIMTPTGRQQEFMALMAVGNGQGLAGYATGVEKELRDAIRSATTNAIKRLRYVERMEDRTVFQDFFAECQGVQLFGQRMPEGFGFRCHRVIKLVCQLVGISDLRVKVLGNTKNYVNITRALFAALVNQETHQQLAERTRLLVVESRRECNYVPTIVAAPKKAPCRQENELKPNEVLDVDEFYGQGRYPLKKPREVPFYELLDSWKRKLWKELPLRNMDDVKIRILADRTYGNLEPTTIERQNMALHKQVLSGEKPIPAGLGWFQIATREDWSPLEKKKK